jgi:hypothetical protein
MSSSHMIVSMLSIIYLPTLCEFMLMQNLLASMFNIYLIARVRDVLR